MHLAQRPQSLTILDAYVKFGMPSCSEARMMSSSVMSSSLSTGDRWVHTKNSPFLLTAWDCEADSKTSFP